MVGALDLTEPKDLFAKLEHELDALTGNRSDSFAAINGLRDGYHLREWIWHARLEGQPCLQAVVTGDAGSEESWNKWINNRFPEFVVIRDLCNGSKHFQPGEVIVATHRAGWDSQVPFFDNPDSGWDDNGFHVETDKGKFIGVLGLVTRVRDFWADLFSRFPELR
jgi:hypothetical protein